MNRDTLRQIVNVLAAAGALAVNGLANALPLNGHTTASISDRFQVYFVPAGYVFAVWGVIYVGLIAFAIFQALPAQRANPRLRRIGYTFALSCVANAVWLFLWHYEVFVLTVPVMALLLITLIIMYLQAGIGRLRTSTAETWCVQVPLSIYLGWITVATVANVAELLDYLRWDRWGLSAETWMIIILAIVFLIVSAVSLTRGDVPYMLVIIWALSGIAVKQAPVPLIANAAWITTALVVVMLAAGWVLRQRRSLATAGT